MTEETAAATAVRGYEPEDAKVWDALVARSSTGTMMHTRRFISYHGDRFRDRSLMVEDRRGKVVGVFPAAEDPADSEMVVSHPGLTYGGLVHDGSLRGASMVEALEEIANYYRCSATAASGTRWCPPSIVRRLSMTTSTRCSALAPVTTAATCRRRSTSARRGTGIAQSAAAAQAGRSSRRAGRGELG